MEFGRHSYLGELTGRSAQPNGRHRDLDMPKGIGMIPLGDRHRNDGEYGTGIFEERVSIDPYTKYRKYT